MKKEKLSFLILYENGTSNTKHNRQTSTELEWLPNTFEGLRESLL